MRKFQDNKRGIKIMESKPVLVLLGILLLVFAWSVFGLFGKMQATGENKELVRGRIEELEKTKENLSTEISKLETAEGKEESIREKFGWVKPGEGVIIVVDDKSLLEANTGDESGGFFNFFKKLFR